MVSLRASTGNRAIPSIRDLAAEGHVFPLFRISEFLKKRRIDIGINVPGGIQIGRAGDVEISHAKVTLVGDGTWSFSGSLHDHGTLVGDNFALLFCANFTLKGPDGITRGFCSPSIIGQLGAVFGPSRDFNFAAQGVDPFIQDNWQNIAETGIHVFLHASAAADQPFSDLFGALKKDVQAFLKAISGAPDVQVSVSGCFDAEGNIVDCDAGPPPVPSD